MCINQGTKIAYCSKVFTNFHIFEPDVLHHDVVGHVHQHHGVERGSN